MYAVNQDLLLAGVSMAAMLCDIIFVLVGCTCPQSMPLSMLLKKVRVTWPVSISLHAYGSVPNSYMHGALLDDRSSTINTER